MKRLKMRSHKESRWKQWLKRGLSLSLAFALLIPVGGHIFAYEETTVMGNLCIHHPEHTVECGYVEATKGVPCTHVHDASCGYVTSEDPSASEEPIPSETPESPTVPEEPETPVIPGGSEEPKEPEAPENPENPAAPEESADLESPVDATVPEESVPMSPDAPMESAGVCTHVHDETCGYREAQEGHPCNYVCSLCVTDWQWDDPEEVLVWNGDAKLWGLGVPNTDKDHPLTLEMLAAMLPQTVKAETAAGPQIVSLTWDFSLFPAQDAYLGDYTLSASLDGDYALTETAPKLEVLISLGGGELFIESADKMKFLNKWYFISQDGDSMSTNELAVYIPDLVERTPAEIQQLLIDSILPQRIGGWVPNDIASDPRLPTLGFIPDDDKEDLFYETAEDGDHQYTRGAQWGSFPIDGWENFPSSYQDNMSFTVRAYTKNKFATGNSTTTYRLFVKSNNPEDYAPNSDRADTRSNPDILSLKITLHNVALHDYVVTPAAPENVTVNLFDYWVEDYGETPVSPQGDILQKNDNHYHEEGGFGALGKTPSKYSTVEDWNKGINKGHLLLFGDGMIHAGLWNKGAGENCRYGNEYAGMEDIVKNVLKDGYPEINLDNANKILTDEKDSLTWNENYSTEKYKLIKDYALTGDHNNEMHPSGNGFAYTSDDIQNLSSTLLQTWNKNIQTDTESLEYLFNPEVSHPNKKSYLKVDGLFQLDDEGYYYYDMRKNFAEFEGDEGFNGGKNHFILYNTAATTRTDGEKSIGNFFPFNDGKEVFHRLDENGALVKDSVDCANNSMNHHLGMTVNVDFRQPANGKINTGSGQKPMTFQFSGDDDVWVFIDDVLVLDMGGIHSEVYGTIDFSTGEVLIGRAFSSGGIPSNPKDPSILVTTTSLKELYQAAGMENATEWSGNIYASNTSHTLKMFYLERGNYDSSIALRFNLQPLLNQQVIKVDQNGQPVKNVGFELYEATDQNVNENTTGAIQCLYTDASTHDGNTFYVKQTGTEPLVSIETDENGSAAFLKRDDDGSSSYFNFADLGDQYYILHEVNTPEGYRSQPNDIVLHYDTTTASLSVANRWTTGAYACSLANVTAGGQLKYGVFNNGTITSGNIPVQTMDQKNGLVVAVPLLEKSAGSWLALYGSNLQGFDSSELFTNGSGEEVWKTNVLTAALNQAKNESNAPWHLNWEEGNQRLQGKLFDLPGLGTRYKLNNSNGDMHMVYGIISHEALNKLGITGSNAEERYNSLRTYLQDHQDYSIEQTVSDLMSGFRFLNLGQFNRDLRSMIYIPNERRELWLQKINQNGNPLPGATFGLYEKTSDILKASGTTDDEGMLIFSPNVSNTPGHANMMWAKSSSTEYYLKEISAPAGYEENATRIPIKVGTYSIYADAGTADNGVSVMAGVGRLTQTMRQYARENNVDVTLQDITAFMQTQSSSSFNLNGWEDATLKGTGNTEVVRSMNLHFNKNAKVDYGLHDQDGGKNQDPYFITDTGYIRARIQQNYAALTGAQYDGVKDGVKYYNLHDADITNLFSLLNIVVVTDQNPNAPKAGQITIQKKLAGSNLSVADYTKNFTFKVELKDTNGDLLVNDYKYFFYGTDKSGYISKGEKTLLLRHDDSVTILGLPKGTKFTITEILEQNSNWLVTPANGVYEGEVGKDGVYEFDASFTNSKDPNDPKPEDPDPEKPDPEEPDPEKPDPEDPDPEKPDPEDPDPEKPDPEDPDPEKPDPEDPDPEKPDPEDPAPENPDPENPGYPTELPDPNDPNSPDEITIWEDGVPKTYIKVWDPEEEEWVYILDEDVPLINWDETPATGDGSKTGLWLLLNVLSLSGLGVIWFTSFRKRNHR